MKNTTLAAQSDNDVFDIKDKVALADLMPIQQYLEMVECSTITSMDGCGNYVKGDKGYESPALSFTPFTVKRHKEEFGFTHVLWYNN